MEQRMEERKEEKTPITPTVWKSTFLILSRINVGLWTLKGEVEGRGNLLLQHSLSVSSLLPDKERTDVGGLSTIWDQQNYRVLTEKDWSFRNLGLRYFYLSISFLPKKQTNMI